MKAKEELREQAVALRKKGLSYNEIRKEVPVSKSTLSLWLKSVPLAEVHRKRLYTKKIEFLSRGAQSQKERRKREIEGIIQAAKSEMATPVSEEAYKLFGAALYWAEGTKGGRFEITNSDPLFILFMTKWIYRVLQIPPEQLKARLNIYPQQNDKEIKKFWSTLCSIPVENFGKSYIKPPNKGYKKNTLYYGTIKIVIPRSTDLKYRTFGWIQSVLGDCEMHAEDSLKRWSRIREVERPVNLL